MIPTARPLRAAIVGLGGIFKHHLHALHAACGVELAAVCDLDPARVAAATDGQTIAGFSSLQEMLEKCRPDILTIATENRSHAPLTLLAAAAGVRAIHCEKPMAVHPREARAMVAACQAAGTLLTVNHQRRVADAGVRAFIAAGGIGDLLELRGYCAGDLLSDGTHLIDSLLALAGDPLVTSVNAGIDLSAMTERYGHPVESGACATFDCPAGPLISIATGSFAARRVYQEYHVTGSRGSLIRIGDRAPNWFIADGKPGTHTLAFNRQLWHLLPTATPEGGPWRLLEETNANPHEAGARIYEAIAHSLAHGSPHPLDGRRTLQVQDLIAACQLSGATRRPTEVAACADLDYLPLTAISHTL